MNDFWEYDQGTDIWTKRADFAGVGRAFAMGFNIVNKGYIGTGHSGINNFQDFWEYTSF